MTHILNILLTNEYIYTPLTWLHCILTKHKVYISILSLIIIPYQKYQYLLIIIMIYIIILATMLLPKMYYKYIKQLLVYFIIYLTLNRFSSIKSQLAKKDILTINCSIIKSNYYLLLPKFSIRIGLIVLMNLLSLKILLYTTMYENILLFIFKLIKIKKWVLMEATLIAVFSCQFLEQIQIYLYKSLISIKIRYNSPFGIIYLINIYFIFSSVVFIKYQIKRVASILYIRKISLINFKIYDFDFMN